MFRGVPPNNTYVGGSGVGSIPPNNPNGNAPNPSAVVQVSHAPPGSPPPFPPAVGPGPMVDNPTELPQIPGPLEQAAAATLPLVLVSNGKYGRGPVLGQLSNDVLGHINGLLEGDIVNQRAFLIATNPYNATRLDALTSIGVTNQEERDAILANDPEARARNLVVDGLDWVPDDQLGPHVASIYNQLRLLETWPSLQQRVVSHLETAFDRLFAPSLDGMSDAQLRTYTSNLFGQLPRLAAWPNLQQRVVSRLETAYDRLFAPGLDGMADAQLRTYMSNLLNQLPRVAAWPSLQQRVALRLQTAFNRTPNENLPVLMHSLFNRWWDLALPFGDARDTFMNMMRTGCQRLRIAGQANPALEAFFGSNQPQ